MRKLIEKLLFKFMSPIDVENYKLKNKVFKYDDFKSIDSVEYFIFNNIIACNEKLTNLSKIDFFDITRIDQHLHLFESTPCNKRLMYWLADSENNMLTDINKHIQVFVDISSTICKEFDKLKKFKGNDTRYNFNIRILQPYIINLISVRKQLLKML